MFKKFAMGALALLISCLPLSGVVRADTPPANLIPNSSLETSANGITPDSWQTSNYSTVANGNTATFSYLNTGHTGSHSLQTQITKFTDGDATWSYADVPVTAGQTYQFSDWYQSTIDTEVDFEVNVSGATTPSYGIVGKVPASSTWKQYTTTFTAPAGATSMSLYHLIAGVGTLTTDDYSLTAYTPTPFTTPMISVTFDDGWASQDTAANQAALAGIPATYYIISDEVQSAEPVDGSDYMNQAQVKSLFAAGNEIGSHTIDHCELTTGLTEPAPDGTACPGFNLNNEMSQSKSTLEGLVGTGNVTDFAYPYGSYNSATIAAGQPYYQSQRTVNPGYNSKDNFDATQLKMYEVDTTTTVAQVQAWIDGAIADNAWLILTYHEVANTAVQGDEGYNVTTADFATEMAYVKSKASVAHIETVSKALAEVQSQLGTSVPPIDTTAPRISEVAGVNATSNGATVAWTTDEASSSQVNYGTTDLYGGSTTLDTTSLTAHSVNLSGLSPGTTYHFQVLSTDAAGNTATSGDFTFTTQSLADTTPPIVSGVAASGLTGSGATITWNTDEASTTQANYGLTNLYGTSTTLDSSLTTAHSVTLTGLSAGTTYHYQVISRDAAGNNASSTDYEFTTPSPTDTTAPTISGVATSNLTTSGTDISWATDEASTGQVNYGTTTSYGQSTALVTTMTTAHVASVFGLTPNTTYHYQVVSTDAAGNTATSGDFTFTTQPVADTTPPVLSNVITSSLTTTSATLAWNTDEASTSQANYGTTSAYDTSSTPDPSLITSHSVALTGLTAGTTYHYQVVSKDATGNTVSSTDYTFTTPLPTDTTPLAISGITSSNLTTSGADINWSTNRASNDYVNYGTTASYGQSTAITTAHTASILGLNPGTTYHYQVVSTDAAGNTTSSIDYTFTTPSPVDTVPPVTPPSNSGVATSTKSVDSNSTTLSTTTTTSTTLGNAITGNTPTSSNSNDTTSTQNTSNKNDASAKHGTSATKTVKSSHTGLVTSALALIIVLAGAYWLVFRKRTEIAPTTPVYKLAGASKGKAASKKARVSKKK